MYKKQVIVIAVTVVVTGFLYFQQPVAAKKSNTSEGHTNSAEAPQRKMMSVSVEMVSAAAKLQITPGLAQQITDTENQLKAATDEASKLRLEEKLAKQWEQVNEPAPAAFYYRDLAEKQNSFDDWLTAGDHFNEAFRADQDTLTQPAFVKDAIACLKNATKLKPGSLEAKTSLGIAYVNQTSLGMNDPNGGSPMQGIMLLLDVVKQDPYNSRANFNLGVFAVQSRQFDKAVERFKTVIEHSKNPGFEPYYYLGECYTQLGLKPDAIAAYEKSKALMPDTAIDRKIDEYIKALKN